MVSHITTITKYRKIHLIGDKGYISKEKKENLAKKKINLIAPYKKNMKNKKTKKKMTNTEKNKKKLRKRYVIEHVNQKIKKYVRLRTRQDKLIITYASFVYLAIGMEFV